MGMAASQARYLALVARKSNCEYEGQQINQSRLALANQSADLFTRLLTLQVPTTPAQSDFQYTTYTFTDGDNEYTIDKWNHLADAEGEGYNYAVTYHYSKEDNVGYQKYKLDPQVLYSQKAPASTDDPTLEITKIEMALTDINGLYEAAKAAEDAKNEAIAKARNVGNYRDKSTYKTVTTNKDSSTQYTVNPIPETLEDGTVVEPESSVFILLNSVEDTEKKESIKKILDTLNSKNYDVFSDSDIGADYANIFYNAATDSIAFAKDLSALDTSSGRTVTPTSLPIYHILDSSTVPEGSYTMQYLLDEVNARTIEYNTAKVAYNNSSDEIYERYNIPKKLGNTELTPLSKVDLMDENVAASIAKIIAKMKEEGIETNLTKCFNTLTEEYNADTYIGGIYSYDQAASTYYTSYYDLYNSVIYGDGVNNIDNQKKLPYYGTQDMDVEIEYTSRALIEKDKSGRFKSIRLEGDSLVYDLTAITEIDQVAYQDAMNEASYQKALYDKKVQEINAKTSIIQQQDKELELRLKQLDTEQNALNTEIDAVSKVVKDNIEKSFKTFGG
mgnify:CR=1 FL=1